MDKYLKSSSLVNWLRQPQHNRRAVSRLWSSLLRSLSVILRWLCWRPGDGRHITIGRDMILGLGDRARLSVELVQNLIDNQITTLAHATNFVNPVTLTEVWKTSVDLNLTGAHAAEWSTFIVELNKSGVILRGDQVDLLLWSGGDGSGVFSVKNCYDALISTFNFPVSQGWKASLWKRKVQQKIILFFWLAVENRLLTWDNLQSKGWIGPGYCLCARIMMKTFHISLFIVHFQRRLSHTHYDN
jgi:hypothetical protein